MNRRAPLEKRSGWFEGKERGEGAYVCFECLWEGRGGEGDGWAVVTMK